MFFSFHDKKYCCNCDWLQYSVIVPNGEQVELTCPEGFRLEVYPGNNIFRHRAILWRCEDAQKYLTMLWSPYSRKLDANLMTVQVGNLLLYRDAIMTSFALLQGITECRFNSLGRVDICLDFEASNYELSVIRALWVGDCYVQHKSEGNDWWHASNDDRGRFVHDMNWGKPKSEIKVKLYNKSRELNVCDNNPDGNKPWIVAEWRSAEMDVRRMWRLEFSLGSAGQMAWQGERIELTDVSKGDWLLSVFLNLYHKRFVCRENLGRRIGHKNLDPIRQLLVLPKCIDGLRWAEPRTEPTATTEMITMLRKLVATLDLPAMSCVGGLYDDVATSILRLCEHKGVSSYFSHAYGDEPIAYLSNKAMTIGAGIVDVTPEPNLDI